MIKKNISGVGFFVAIAFVCTQACANELPNDYIYLPKTFTSSVTNFPINAPNPSSIPISVKEKILRYIDYQKLGMTALKVKDKQKAYEYFKMAEQYAPANSMENDQYFSILKDLGKAKPSENVSEIERVAVVNHALDQYSNHKSDAASNLSLLQEKVLQPSPVTGLPKKKPVLVTSEGLSPIVLQLEDIIKSTQTRPGIRLDYGSTVILEGKDIKRLLAMDEGFIESKIINRNQVQVKAVRRGATFLNIWDDQGRKTIYVDVVFAKSEEQNNNAPVDAAEEHEKPFRFTYMGDYDTYYYGAKGDDFKRQSYNINESFALEGQTPYGYLDTSAVAETFSGVDQLSTYTLGLSHVPLARTKDLNLRFFDASKYLSPLTMPNTRLHGVFADVNINDWVGASFSHGQKKALFSFISQGNTPSADSYIDAARVTLFPSDPDTHYAVNLAKAYGQDREQYLTKSVYSFEAKQKILKAILNGEYAKERGSHSSLAGFKWREGQVTTALNFREINKDFTTISGFPSAQGETGLMWSTSMDAERIGGETVFDVYKQHLYSNPNNPSALNYNANGHLRIPLMKDFWSDTNFYYVHTPGEVSPRRNIGLDERLSRSIGIWQSRKATVYLGSTLQRTRYELSSGAEYDRFSLLPGIQVPLTSRLSTYTNYEYSWIHEIASANNLTPNVLTAGFYYNRQFTNTLSGNLDFSYRKEMNAKGANSFLAGEDSAGLSLGLTYNPNNDMSYFIDGRARKVWPHVGDALSYNDLDVRFGVRLIFDVLPGWDPHGRVRGHVYKDDNGNGKIEIGERGIAGVRMKVGNKEMVTDKDGAYSADVRAKSVMVSPVMESLPSGTIFSTATFNKVAIAQGRKTQVDFGLTSQTGIYGLVFVDKNGNGAPDSSDQYIRKVKIVLDGKVTEETDSQGTYYFRKLGEGKHTVAIDLNSLPINMIPLIKIKNEISITEGATYIFHIPLKTQKEK